MSVTTRIVREAKLRRHTVSGPITLPVLHGSLTDVYTHPDCDRTLDVFWLLRDVSVEFSPEDVRRLWDAAGPRRRGAPAAIVATKKFALGMARTCETVMSEKSGGGHVTVSHSLDEAEEWLGAGEFRIEEL